MLLRCWFLMLLVCACALTPARALVAPNRIHVVESRTTNYDSPTTTALELSVHMNGRIYDPLLGRFLSADILVDGVGSLQGYNRYSYVKNNPLTNTDPSGFLTVAQHQSEIEALERQKEEALRKAYADKASQRAIFGINRGYDLKINEHKIAQDHIVTVAARMVKVSGNEVNIENVTRMAGSLDDDHTDFKQISAIFTGSSFVPGTAAGEAYVMGDMKGAINLYSRDVVITLATMGAGKLLQVAGKAGGVGATATADLTEMTVAQVTQAAESIPTIGGRLPINSRYVLSDSMIYSPDRTSGSNRDLLKRCLYPDPDAGATFVSLFYGRRTPLKPAEGAFTLSWLNPAS